MKAKTWRDTECEFSDNEIDEQANLHLMADSQSEENDIKIAQIYTLMKWKILLENYVMSIRGFKENFRIEKGSFQIETNDY